MVKANLVRDGQQDSVQLLHQLFEGRSLGGNSMPALAHHHVATEKKHTQKLYLQSTMRQMFNIFSFAKHVARSKHLKKGFAYSSCVQLEGLSMRCPSFSSLKSSSTGIPGYGEPPSVKISHISTPNDHLSGKTKYLIRSCLPLFTVVK